MDGENMELMYPYVIKIGIPLLIAAVVILHVIPARNKKEFTGGIRTGAASIVKSLPIYEKLYKRSRILTFITECFISGDRMIVQFGSGIIIDLISVNKEIRSGIEIRKQSNLVRCRNYT